MTKATTPTTPSPATSTDTSWTVPPGDLIAGSPRDRELNTLTGEMDRTARGHTLSMGESIYLEKRWTDFVVDMVSGDPVRIRALGVAMDGDQVVFFNHWPTGGSRPVGTRIERSRLVSVTTDCAARTARESS